jgi:WhiB family transcriptional regulator, redox-sensing transcriptional regulator
MTQPHQLDTTWHEHAACRGTDPETFYDNRHVEQAVAICSTCPVRRNCHTYAKAAKEQYGVWGGDTSRLRATSHRPERLTATSAERILAELHANHTTWTTPHALAERLHYEPNTVQKVLRRLIDAGAPIQHEPGGYYRLRVDVGVTA